MHLKCLIVLIESLQPSNFLDLFSWFRISLSLCILVGEEGHLKSLALGATLVSISWRRAGQSLSSTLSLALSHWEPQQSCGVWQTPLLARGWARASAQPGRTAASSFTVNKLSPWGCLCCHQISSSHQNYELCVLLLDWFCSWVHRQAVAVKTSHWHLQLGGFNSWEPINWQLAASEATSFSRFLLNTYINRYPWWVTSSPLLTYSTSYLIWI